MLGTLRFVLASMVLFSHIYVHFSFNIGISAVIVFFMISGYVMTHLVVNHYRQNARYFYLDRLLRIYPQYFLYLVITQISLFFMDFHAHGFYFSGEPTFFLFLLNSLLIPTNYFFAWGPLAKYLLIPPAWSLALEEQFYLLFPWIVAKRWFCRILSAFSLMVFATSALGWIPEEVFPREIYGYRTLPGVLFIFVLGKSLAEYVIRKDRESLWTIVFLYLASLLIMGVAWQQAILDEVHNLEILSAILIGFPILVGLCHLRRRQWDEVLGYSSYGIFLNHTLIINYFYNWNVFWDWTELNRNRFVFFIVVFVFSTIASYLSYFLVEKFVNFYRYKIRERSEQRSP